MRKIILILSLCCTAYFGIAQSWDDYVPFTALRTPKGSEVRDTWRFTGMEIIWGSNELADYDEYISETYNGATRIGDPTRTYNCHAYAWRMSEGYTDPVWIGVKPRLDPVSIYWTDGSYIEVPENVATKVVYVGNHSAVRINSSTYRSKWGAGPIVEHGPNDVPIEYHNHNSSNPKRYFIANPLATSSIFGPDRTEPNTRQNYVAPLRPSVTFTGWTITPSSYTTTGGTNENTQNSC